LYRSAVVMGWNFAYDRIREWIFKDSVKLGAFNAELAKIQKKGKPAFDPIVTYDDFFDGRLGEAQVIDTCEDAGIIKGKVHADRARPL
jgi:hypothetical protein